MGVLLPPTLSGNLSLESAYFLIQGPLPRSPLTLSPHKCVTSSITFLFKKMSCPPWLCILETLSLSQNKGVHLLNQLLGSGSCTPGPVIGPGMTRRIPVLQEVTDSVVVLNPRSTVKLENLPKPRLHSKLLKWESLKRDVGNRTVESLPPHGSDLKPEL